jgi:hypothetical protein
MGPKFEWDDEKARANVEKHEVGFAEGATVFNDEFVATLSDPDHSIDEERLIAIGMSVKGRLLVVSFTERRSKTRLISCRVATPAERKAYEEET